VDRLRPRFLPDLQHLVADLVDCLVPLDARPPAVDELHRIFQAPFAADQLAYRGAFGAMRAPIDRRIPARLLADPDAVGDFRRDRAADRTMRADTLVDRRAGSKRTSRSSLGFPHASQRQGADCREAACNKAGSAQESTAIETGTTICSKSRERTAARLSFRSLDQHGLCSFTSSPGSG